MKKLLGMMVLSVAWTSAFAAEPQYEVGVDGLACPFCAYGIEKRLSSIDDVKDVAVDITKGVVIVTMTEGSVLSEPLAREKVEDAGFGVRSFARVADDL